MCRAGLTGCCLFLVFIKLPTKFRSYHMVATCLGKPCKLALMILKEIQYRPYCSLTVAICTQLMSQTDISTYVIGRNK